MEIDGEGPNGAALVSATAGEEAPADEPATKPKPWDVCEAYGAKECGKNDDRCSLCSTPGGAELCFDNKIADKLPPCESAGEVEGPRARQRVRACHAA